MEYLWNLMRGAMISNSTILSGLEYLVITKELGFKPSLMRNRFLFAKTLFDMNEKFQKTLAHRRKQLEGLRNHIVMVLEWPLISLFSFRFSCH